jgi:F420-non-reducing hydrogenase iron-sulfur subunit
MPEPLHNHEHDHATGLHNGFEPKIVAFFCNWCTYIAADLACTSRMRYAPNVRVIRVMCSGRVDPQFVIDAFARGADGVLVGGCHPGDCHYIEGNYKTLRRFHLLKRMLHDLGIEEERVRLEWISASEGEKLRWAVNDMVAKLRPLGPLQVPAHHLDWDKETEHLAEQIAAKEEGVAHAHET